MKKLTVQVNKAILTRSTELVKDMDPYVQLQIMQQKNKTNVLTNKGDMPEWNQTIEFILSTNGWAIVMLVQVKDYNNVKDSLIGQVSVEINPKNLQSINGQKWHSLKYNKKPAGKIMLDIKCAPFYVGYYDEKISASIPSNIRLSHTQPKISLPQTIPIYNSDSKIIKLNKSTGFSMQKNQNKNKNSKINLSGSFNLSKPFNIISTNQTFYTGKKGVRHGVYSAEKFNSNISNQNSGIKLKQVPHFIKMTNTFSNIKM